MKKKRYSKGFTLIELSIIIVIAASIAAGILAILSIDSSLRASKITVERLDRIQEAIGAFQQVNGYLPCPANRNEAVNTEDYGVATNCALSTHATSDEGSDEERIRIGVIPTRSINLPDLYAVDGWNNKFTYVVVADLARTQVMYNNYVTTATNGVIQVLDGDGNQILDNTADFPVVAYVLLSHGQNGKGGYTANGPMNGNPCTGTTTKDTENCDNDIVFTDTVIDDFTTTVADVFDDYVRWETRTGAKRFAEIYNQ